MMWLKFGYDTEFSDILVDNLDLKNWLSIKSDSVCAVFSLQDVALSNEFMDSFTEVE